MASLHTDVFTLAARDWFAAYLVNILAIAGPIAAAFMSFHLWQGDFKDCAGGYTGKFPSTDLIATLGATEWTADTAAYLKLFLMKQG